MYKIFTKLNTNTNDIYRVCTIQNDNGKTVPYEADTAEKAADKAVTLLGEVGYDNLLIAEDKSYYMDLTYGTKVVVPQETYTLTYNNINFYTVDVNPITSIVSGSSVSSVINFTGNIKRFHLIIDGTNYSDGNPGWISYKEIDTSADYIQSLIITYTGITKNHTIEIVIDE